MPRKGYIWVKMPEKVTFTPNEKSKLLKQLEEFISASVKLKEKVKSSAIRGNRLYLYEHLEPSVPDFEGEYFRWNYARITFKDKTGENCTADWQRANEQWIEFHKGTFTECLEFIEKGGGFFS
jgi:hypothetical protein